MHEVKLYCESNNHNGTIIFDTVDLQGLKQLWDDEFVDKKWNAEDHRSLIEVTDLKYFPYTGPREGHWYEVPYSFWRNFNIDFEYYSLEHENASLLFRLKITYKSKDEKLDFYKYTLNSFEK